jgi:pimeloyl-ACP methyl ester carboxylesterase
MMEDRLVNIRGLFACTGCNILMVEYRGYGTSEGEPSEDGLKLDAQAALDYLHDARDDVDGRQIFAFGRSLGGAVAIWLAHKNPLRLRGIMVENSFTSVREMATPIFPFLRFIRARQPLAHLGPLHSVPV